MASAVIKSIPAPVGGWNARDSIDQMDEKDAISLVNWFPSVGKVELRKGFDEYATGLGGNVETLAEFHAGATRKFIAAANGNIWDISSSGAASSLASGFTVNRWQWANFNGNMGLVNGTDAPQIYTGSAVSAMTVSGSSLTVANLVGINVYKSRTYFWEENSQDFWYSATNALGGTLTRFPLSRVGQFGGNLTAMGTWTRDGGSGMDDLAVFIMSSGEVIIYQGSDPGDAADWALVGVFRIGAPLSIRSVIKVGGDLVVGTKDGYVPLSMVISEGRLNDKNAVSNKISGAVVAAAQSYGSNYGWQAILYPRGNRIIFNVPQVTNTTYQQHVVNTITGAWCKFTGMEARCWGLYNDRLYFGGNESVYLADEGYDDNGSNIDGDAWTAYSYFGDRSHLKLFTGIQPVLSSDGGLPLATKLVTDFAEPSGTYQPTSIATAGAEWDVATWDVSDWSGGQTITKQWRSGNGLGYNAAVRLRTRTQGQAVSWYSINYMFKRGGLL